MIRFYLLGLLLFNSLISAASESNAGKDSLQLIHSGEILREALQLHNEKKYELALEKLMTVPESDTNYYAVRSKILDAYIGLENYEKAIEIGEWGIKQQSAQRARFYATLGIAYEYNEERQKAIDTYLAGLKRYPYDFFLHHHYGITLFKKEDLGLAQVQFEKSISLNPYFSNSHLYLGDIVLKQGKRSRAMMCMLTYLALEPQNNRILVLINDMVKNVLSYENSTPEKEANPYFHRLDLLLKSNAALDPKFKSSISFKAPVAQQAELLLESIRLEEDVDDFWMRFYVPLLAEFNISGVKQTFIYHILTSVDDKGVKKWNKTHKKDQDRFFSIANKKIKELRAHNVATLEGTEETYTFWYYDNHQLNAIGNQKDDDTFYGPWVFYHPGGERMAEGRYLSNGRKTGKWKYYYNDGQLKKEEEFDGEGRLAGLIFNYYRNGKILNEVPIKDEEVEGVVKVYYPCGQLKDELSYIGGKKEGAGSSYYASGQLSSKFTHKDGELEGTDTYYYKNGKVKEIYIFKEGVLNGSFRSFHSSGKLNQEGEYEAGKRKGEWKGFHSNGLPEYTGVFSAGKRTGIWLNYSKGGALVTEDAYNAEGQLHGKSKLFLEDGTLQAEFSYKNSIMTGYKFFGDSGKILSEAANPAGNLKMTGFYPDGQKKFEGAYKAGKKDGLWIYFYHNGEISTTCFYKDDEYDGLYTFFYESGQRNYESQFTKGVENGLYRSYYKSGQVKIEGWMVDDQAQQTWIKYYPDGTINYRQYNLNGEYHGIYQEFDKLGRPYVENRNWEGNITHKTLFDTLGGVIRADTLDMGNGKVYFSFADKTQGFEFDLSCNEYSTDLKSYYKNGNLFYTKPIKNGELNGCFQSFYANKRKLAEGEYIDDLQSGLWNWYYESGQLESKSFLVDGKMEGESSAFYENGQPEIIATYENGKRKGSSRFYTPDGALLIEKIYDEHGLVSYRYLTGKDEFSAFIKMENREGKVKAYFPNGKPSVEQNYKKGFLDGVQLTYYPSGQVLVKRTLQLGEEEGVREEYYADGKKRKISPYKEGELHGQVIEYFPSGAVKRKTSYLFGEKDGWEEIYDKNGKLLSREYYRDDFIY